MSKFASPITAVAVLVVAALPGQALAATTVKVSDLDLLTPTGLATFALRADRAADQFCAGFRDLGARATCEAAVKTELTEKAAVLRAARERAATSFAAR